MKYYNFCQGILDANRGQIKSSKGGWRIGEAVYNHGYSMLDELVGKVSYFQVMLLNVTGKLPSEAMCKWLEASYICMSWPDPRIWCNYIGALAGSARTSPAAGVLAGTLASDSRMYGPGSLPNCMNFIRQALKMRDDGCSWETVIKQRQKVAGDKPVIPGYARPIAKGDERVSAMQKVGKDLGFQPGRFELLALELEKVLSDNFDESMNIGGYTAAFLADQGISAKQMYQFTSTRVTAGIQACFSEAFEKTSGCFLPLRCTDISYHGPAIRPIINQ